VSRQCPPCELEKGSEAIDAGEDNARRILNGYHLRLHVNPASVVRDYFIQILEPGWYAISRVSRQCPPCELEKGSEAIDAGEDNAVRKRPVSTGIISACMSTLRPLFVIISSKFSNQAGMQKTRTTQPAALDSCYVVHRTVVERNPRTHSL
jgi:hypothetical protein